jgi:hypothetical protein
VPAHQTSSALNAGPNPTTLESLKSHLRFCYIREGAPGITDPL